MPAACQSLPSFTQKPHIAPRELTSRDPPSQRHPIGFYAVCLAVFCERCAAYILGASMVVLLCARYGYTTGDALRLAALVNAVNYLGTLPGGLALSLIHISEPTRPY